MYYVNMQYVVIFLLSFFINLLIYFFYWKKKLKEKEEIFSSYLSDLDNQNIKLKKRISSLIGILENYEKEIKKNTKKNKR